MWEYGWAYAPLDKNTYSSLTPSSYTGHDITLELEYELDDMIFFINYKMNQSKKLYVLIIMDGIQKIYEDMMLMVMHGLDSIEMPHTYLYYHVAIERGLLKNDNHTQCVFFGTRYLFYGVHIPNGSIVTDFDHLHWIHERLSSDIICNNRIMTFSSSIAEYILQKEPSTFVDIFKFGYSKYFDFGYVQHPEYKYDICFLGTLSDRRTKIIDQLKEKYNVYVHSHIEKSDNQMTTKLKHIFSGEERATLYSESKIVLSISFSDEYKTNCNASRIFPAVSTGAFVISEKCLDDNQNENIDKICMNVSLEDLYDTIDKYIKDNEEREKKRLEYYNNVKDIITLCK